jgi:hypothetical protein
MSGGSYNYLYAQEQYKLSDLEAMRQRLRALGMYEAAEATQALIPRRASDELEQLWKAVEWLDSSDWSFAEVARAFVTFEQSLIGAET